MRVSLPLISLAGSLLLAATAAAQMGPEPSFMLSGPGPMMQFKTADVGNDAAPVKGLPFCATITTEHTQMLADNNRIHTTNNATLCRDSEGRTRREANLNLMGAAPQTSAPKLITIVDPVAGIRYVLDTEHKIAHKMPLKPGPAAGPDSGPGVPAKGEHVMIYQRAGSSGPNLVFNDVIVNKTADSSDPAPTSESLGDQSINGIHATGTRMTTTIPAGKMGNEKPITVTSERWYSPELQVTVMTKHNDPWAGEIKTEFTNVNTSEPDASLFAVPSDYKVEDDKDGQMRVQFFRHGPPPPPPAQ